MIKTSQPSPQHPQPDTKISTAQVGQKKRSQWTPEMRAAAADRCRRHRPWQSSTGPRTKAGKYYSSLNATKHGLYSSSRKEFRRFVRELLERNKLMLALVKSLEAQRAVLKKLEEKPRVKKFLNKRTEFAKGSKLRSKLRGVWQEKQESQAFFPPPAQLFQGRQSGRRG